MAYKYIPASLSSTAVSGTPKERYLGFFQETLNRQFYNASDWFTIQEETSLGSKTYQNIDVRINHMIDAETGKNMSDDFKRILFKDISHSVDLGRYYQFDDNYWITFNLDKIKSLNSTASVRRCNNTLRFIDTSGAYHSLPCNIDYLIKENRDYSTAGTALVIPSGAIEVMVQRNAESNLIRPNQRFLFGSPGNWTAYKVVGGGIGNFNNMKTTDNTSQGLIRFTMDTNYVNESTDDLVNGIADYYQNVYVVTLSDHTIGGIVSGTTQLSAVVTLNGTTVTRDLVWSSSDITVATVSTSGLVTYLKVGTANITCSLKDNLSVHDHAAATVSAIPVNDYKITISPTTNFIYQGQQQDYSIYLDKNGSHEIDTFAFTVSGGGTSGVNYTFTALNGNQFRIKNLAMYLNSPLVIHCVPNFHAEYTTDVSILLKGAW